MVSNCEFLAQKAKKPKRKKKCRRGRWFMLPNIFHLRPGPESITYLLLTVNGNRTKGTNVVHLVLIAALTAPGNALLVIIRALRFTRVFTLQAETVMLPA